MPTRRTFLQSAAAVSTAQLAPKLVFAANNRRPANIGVIYDERFAQARDFADRADTLSVPTRAIAGDITNLWQQELRDRWQQTPVPVAGLTERPALFLLEQLAWDYDLRVVFLAEHEDNDSGRPRHAVVRSELTDLAALLDGAGPTWPAALAERMLTAPRELASHDSTPSGAAMASHFGEPAKLYSWIIAPRPTAASI